MSAFALRHVCMCVSLLMFCALVLQSRPLGFGLVCCAKWRYILFVRRLEMIVMIGAADCDCGSRHIQDLTDLGTCACHATCPRCDVIVYFCTQFSYLACVLVMASWIGSGRRLVVHAVLQGQGWSMKCLDARAFICACGFSFTLVWHHFAFTIVNACNFSFKLI